MLTLSAVGHCYANREFDRILKGMRELAREFQDFLETPRLADTLPQNDIVDLKEAYLALARTACFQGVRHDRELSQLLAGVDTDIRNARID